MTPKKSSPFRPRDPAPPSATQTPSRCELLSYCYGALYSQAEFSCGPEFIEISSATATTAGEEGANPRRKI